MSEQPDGLTDEQIATIEAAEESHEQGDFETAQDRSRQQLADLLRRKLSAAEVAAARDHDESLIEYAERRYDDSTGKIAAATAGVDDGFASDSQEEMLKAKLPAKAARCDDEETLAEDVLTEETIEECKRRGISASTYLDAEYDIDASIHDMHSLQAKLSEERTDD
jgi:hypothetical protein